MKARIALLGSLLGVSIFATGAGAAGSDLNEAGKAAYERGDYDAAERLFKQAVTREPRDPLLHYHRGVALMRLSRWREASACGPATGAAIGRGPIPVQDHRPTYGRSRQGSSRRWLYGWSPGATSRPRIKPRRRA